MTTKIPPLAMTADLDWWNRYQENNAEYQKRRFKDALNHRRHNKGAELARRYWVEAMPSVVGIRSEWRTRYERGICPEDTDRNTRVSRLAFKYGGPVDLEIRYYTWRYRIDKASVIDLYRDLNDCLCALIEHLDAEGMGADTPAWREMKAFLEAEKRSGFYERR